jgi:hypothetical protein
MALGLDGVLGVVVGVGASSSSASSWVGSGSCFSGATVVFSSAAFGASASRRCGAGSCALP